MMRDYDHAAQIFLVDNFAKSPKHPFLYSVFINTIDSNKEIGVLAKQVTLPKATFTEDTVNAYNRARIVQHKVNYDSVNITFHDDCSEIARNFLFDYYSYYYADSDNAGTKTDGYNWGYRGKSKPYINWITITSLFHGRISEYKLINPILKNMSTSDHNASDGSGIMQNQITVDYEYFLLRSDKLTAENAPGFAPGKNGTKRPDDPRVQKIAGYKDPYSEDSGDPVKRLRESARTTKLPATVIKSRPNKGGPWFPSMGPIPMGTPQPSSSPYNDPPTYVPSTPFPQDLLEEAEAETSGVNANPDIRPTPGKCSTETSSTGAKCFDWYAPDQPETDLRRT